MKVRIGPRKTVRYRVGGRKSRVKVKRGVRRLESGSPVLVCDPIALEASLCRDSFYDFVQSFWPVIIPEDPVWNWHIKVLCDELQEVAERIFRGEQKKHDLVINIPPGTTKSTITSVMWPAWCWTRMPTFKTICVSYGHKLALDLAMKSRDIVESAKWKSLFGDIELREDANAKNHFVNKHGGWRLSSGVDGVATGFHAHAIIIDDPLDPEQAVSEQELANANRTVCSKLPTRKVDKSVSVMVIIMQRLHQNDPSALFLEKQSKAGSPVKHICLPGEIWATGPKAVKPRKLARYYQEGMLDPVRLAKHHLQELHSGILGEYGYAGQILQTPTPLGGGMFKISRIEIDEPPPLRHFKRFCRYWDKAGTAVRKGVRSRRAWTVGVLMGIDAQDQIWILDVVRGRWEANEREKIILQTAQADAALVPNGASRIEIGVEQEPGSGGKESAEATLRHLRGFLVRLDRPQGDKDTRADPFAVQVNGGNVKMKAGEWNGTYLAELEHFPNSQFKDQADASSGAFGLLNRQRTRVGGLGK